jgi:hypothetical protein
MRLFVAEDRTHIATAMAGANGGAIDTSSDGTALTA